MIALALQHHWTKKKKKQKATKVEIKSFPKAIKKCFDVLRTEDFRKVRKQYDLWMDRNRLE